MTPQVAPAAEVKQEVPETPPETPAAGVLATRESERVRNLAEGLQEARAAHDRFRELQARADQARFAAEQSMMPLTSAVDNVYARTRTTLIALTTAVESGVNPASLKATLMAYAGRKDLGWDEVPEPVRRFFDQF